MPAPSAPRPSRRHPGFTASLMSAGLVLSGCSGGGSGDRDAAPPGPARLTLGTGELHYVPIEGEPVLQLVAGIQGGFHVWATFLGYGYEGDRLEMRVTTAWGEDDAYLFPSNLAAIRVHEVVDEQGEAALEGSGWPARIEQARCSHGQRVRMEMTVSDDAGRSAQDTRYFVSEVQEELRSTDCP
jgi:hypothetical protein